VLSGLQSRYSRFYMQRGRQAHCDDVHRRECQQRLDRREAVWDMEPVGHVLEARRVSIGRGHDVRFR
jgi:hypothetical protein